MRQQKLEAALKAIVAEVEQTGGKTHAAHADRDRFQRALVVVLNLAREGLK
jgi:hypothetical protein